MERKIKKEAFVLYGADFPDEYVRKVLQKEGLIFPVKKGLYLLKNRGEDAAEQICHIYWPIIEKLLKKYEPWSIEKESALRLYLGDESIPRKLQVRTRRKVKYKISLPFGLQVRIRPDPAFQEKTRQTKMMGKTGIHLDTPERVLLSIRKRKGIVFTAFLKGVKFDRRMLEVLYSANPKPIVVKDLIRIAEKHGKTGLARQLSDLLKRYTIYRP